MAEIKKLKNTFNNWTEHKRKINEIIDNGGGGGGGGFTPTETQLEAMNSGITTAKTEQITVNKNNTQLLSQNKLDKLTDEGEFVYSHEGAIQNSKGFEVADEPSGSAAHVTSSKTVKAVKTALDTAKLDKKTSTGKSVYSHDGSTQDEMAVKTAMSATPADTNILTEKGVKNYVDGKNPLAWKYVGILGGSVGSTLTVEDDWSELLFVARLKENSDYYNHGQIIPKVVFTQGSPTNGNVFIGFYWNDNYNYKTRVGLYGSGTNRYIKNDYPRSELWVISGLYIYKR